MNIEKKIERLECQMQKKALFLLPLWRESTRIFFGFCEDLTDSQVSGLSGVANRDPSKATKPPRVIRQLERPAIKKLLKDSQTLIKLEKRRLNLEYYQALQMVREEKRQKQTEPSKAVMPAQSSDTAVVENQGQPDELQE